MSELLATATGMGAGQIAVQNRAGLSPLHKNATRVGSKTPAVLKAAGTLEVLGQQQCGDFSGTLQQINSWRPDEAAIFGSGGPANLRYGPTGTDTIVAAGRLLADGTTTSFTAELTPGTYRPTWDYRCSIRSIWKTLGAQITGVSWDPTTFKLSKTNLAVSCADDGFTLCKIEDADTGGNTGWYLVDHAAATGDDVYLTEDRFDAVVGQTPAAGSALVNPSASSAMKVRFCNSSQATLVRAATWVDSATYDLPAIAQDLDTITIGATTYTFAGPASPGQIEIFVGSMAELVSNIVAVLSADTTITIVDSGTYVAASVTHGFVTIRSSTTTTYALSDSSAVGGAWDTATVGNKLVVANSGTPFSAYTSTGNDTLEVRTGDAGAITRQTARFTKVLAKVSSTTLQVEDVDWATPGANDLYVVLFKRTAFEDQACTWTTDGTAITLGSALTFTPRAGDFYYIYAFKDNGGGDVWDPQPENNPEEAPTISQLSSKFCSWPYGHMGKNTKSSNRSESGFGNLIAAVDGTLMNHAWFGDLLVAPRCFLSGDKLELDVGPIDTTFNGTPFLIETLLIPNFDPERHWQKKGNVPLNGKLLDSAVAFQSPPFTLGGFRPTHITITGACGSVQTTSADEGGDNISHEWTIKYAQGPSSAGSPGKGAFEGDPRLLLAERRVTKTIDLCARVSRGSWDPGSRTIDQVGAFIRWAGNGEALDGDVFIVERGTGWKQGAYLVDADATNGLTVAQRKRKVILIAGQPGMGSVSCADLVGYVPDVSDWHNNPVRWTFLMAGVHPSRRGIHGLHGYYPGEPFDCETGNGGLIFGCSGQRFNGQTAANVKLPTGPRFRCSSLRYTWSPGGTG